MLLLFSIENPYERTFTLLTINKITVTLFILKLFAV
jgi:hypothetical protein